ncbi:hypothetical protein JTB14_036014 [Gonioctena quinquepunctata]|nr:hypothetical protein JTB14_036014 [Gonioctena quinquepunctata]
MSDSESENSNNWDLLYNESSIKSNNEAQSVAGVSDSNCNYVNILLLGEPSIEHSTFINSLANYLIYADPKEAEKDELLVLVPTTFRLRDWNQELQDIAISYPEDDNPFLETTMLHSKEIHSYVFPIDGGQTKIRLIDTSIVKDSEEVDEDKVNFGDIVKYVSSLKELHAVCFEFKSIPSKHTMWFQCSMAQILSEIDEALSKKFVFIFNIDDNSAIDDTIDVGPIEYHTNSALGNIPIFHINNKAFKYMAAMKNDIVDTNCRNSIIEDWVLSARQSKRFIDGIKRIPNDKCNTESLEKNVRDVLMLYKLIAELSRLLKAMKKSEEILREDHPVRGNVRGNRQQQQHQQQQEQRQQKQQMSSDDEEVIIDKKYEKQEINILLLGETGVGKSTFINSVANYLTHSELEIAEAEKLLVLIPTSFDVETSKGKGKKKGKKTRTIKVGSEDKNEFLDTGVSATQDVKTYVFPICDGQVKVRLIDTPGMGDTRGIRQDDANSENILSYIAQLQELHAVCFLFRPIQARQTVFFQYCMAQIFSRLDKSASKNIIFVFTNTRGADYTGGETLTILKKVAEDIKKRPPYVEIPLDRNIFCFDNEAFRYLAAVQEGVEYEASQRERYKESWKCSSKECWKLIKYILGDDENPALEPHHVQSTSAINEARRMIIHLCQPLAEISQLINHNMNVLQRHEENLLLENQSIQDLTKQLFMPVITLEIIEVPQPVTVCTSRQCAEVYQVGGRNKWHYKQRCHDPCYLQNVPKEIIGSPELINCAAMNGKAFCKECNCNFQLHMHVYYMTETKEVKEKDPNIEKNINSKQGVMENVRKLIEDMQIKKEELDGEHQIIITTCARFAHFLQNNAITPFSDSYKEYIEYLLNQERSLGTLCSKETTDYLQKLLKEYEEIKASFDHALKLKENVSSDVAVTPREITESIADLFELKHNGEKIKELYECQKKARKREYQNSEYVHSKPMGHYQNKKNKKNNVQFGRPGRNEDAYNNYGRYNYNDNMNYNGPMNYNDVNNQNGPPIDQNMLARVIGVLSHMGIDVSNSSSSFDLNVDPRQRDNRRSQPSDYQFPDNQHSSYSTDDFNPQRYSARSTNIGNFYQRSSYSPDDFNPQRYSARSANDHGPPDTNRGFSGYTRSRSSDIEGSRHFMGGNQPQENMRRGYMESGQQHERDPFYYPPNSPFEQEFSASRNQPRTPYSDNHNQHSENAKPFWRRFLP